MRDRFEAGFHIYDRWLALRQRGEGLAPFFKDNYLGSERIENLLEELGMEPRFVGCVRDVAEL